LLAAKTMQKHAVTGAGHRIIWFRLSEDGQRHFHFGETTNALFEPDIQSNIWNYWTFQILAPGR
jgi:hypothetical protein